MPNDSVSARVLIVDDERAFAEIIAELLGDEGYCVDRVADGVAALACLADEYDAIVCDVMLPGMRGDELALEIRGRYPTRRLPIVLLSAGGNPQVDLRDVWFMAKPLDIADLLALLKGVFGHHEATRVATC